MKKPQPLINESLMQEFFERSSKELAGNWILVGGSLLLALGISQRVTRDIDFVCMKDTKPGDMIKLMDCAASLNLEIEVINSSAEYFLKKIKGFEKHLLPLYSKSKLKVLRPNALLYAMMKLPRSSDSDVDDIIGYSDWSTHNNEMSVHTKQQVLKMVEEHLSKNDHRFDRLKRLLEYFSA
jgi:hypothetical protein